MKRYQPDRLEVTALVLIAVLAITLLTVPRFVGVADNGDFSRLLHWGKFAYPILEYHDQYFGWVTRHYLVERSPLRSWYGFPSSEALFIKTSAILGLLLSRERFDLRVLGFVHVIAFVISLAMLFAGWRRVIGKGARALIPLVVIVFCDIGYLVYFHSFYAESASLIFLLATVGLGLMLTKNPTADIRLLLCFYLAATGLVTAKAQNAPFAGALLVWAAYLHFTSKSAAWRRANVAGVALMTAAAFGCLLITPPRMREANLYNSVFNGVLRTSSAPAEDLAALRLPAEYSVLRETTFFDVNQGIDINGDEFRSRFYGTVSTRSVIGFYLRHPSRLLQMLEITSARAYSIRPPSLGNFEKASGMPYESKATRWNLWSQAKQRYFPKSVWFSIALFAFSFLLIAIYWSRSGYRGVPVLLLSVWLMLIISFFTPIPGDGQNDLEKHLFNYNAILDLFLLLTAGYVASLAWKRLDARRAA